MATDWQCVRPPPLLTVAKIGVNILELPVEEACNSCTLDCPNGGISITSHALLVLLLSHFLDFFQPHGWSPIHVIKSECLSPS